MKKLLPLCLLAALTACSNQPNQLIFNPVYQGGKISNISANVSTSVIDLRGDNVTLKIIESDKIKTLASPGITDSVKSTLDSALSRNGANISNLSTTRFELDIHKLQAVVTEKMMSHSSNATIEFGVRVVKNASTFNKIYQGNATLEGPLRHERAKIEGQLNKLTEQIITRIVSDPELIAYLEG